MDNQTPERALERYNLIVDYFIANPDRLNESNKHYLDSFTPSIYRFKLNPSPTIRVKASGLSDKIDTLLRRELILVFPKEGDKK